MLTKAQRYRRDALIRGLFELYLEAGRRLTQKQIGGAVGHRLGIVVDEWCVGSVLRKAGYDTEDVQEERWWGPETIEDRIGEKRLRSLLEQAVAGELFLVDIAKTIGASPNTLRGYCERYGLIEKGKKLKHRAAG